jgi:hypothetical protein
MIHRFLIFFTLFLLTKNENKCIKKYDSCNYCTFDEDYGHFMCTLMGCHTYGEYVCVQWSEQCPENCKRWYDGEKKLCNCNKGSQHNNIVGIPSFVDKTKLLTRQGIHADITKISC